MAEINSTTHYVYLFHANGLYKIGRTSNVRKRLSGLACALPGGIESVHTIACDEPTAKRLERILHIQYADRRAYREWFDLSHSDIQAITIIQSPSDFIEQNINLITQKSRRPVSEVPGANVRERERIKRKCERWINRLGTMSKEEREYIVKAINIRYD